MHTFHVISKRIFVPILIIAAGVLLLMFNTGALPLYYKPVVFSWQMLITAVGVVSLFSSRHHKFIAIMLVLLGTLLLLPKFDIDGIELLRLNTLPIVCILIGLFFLVHILFGRKHDCCQRHYHRRLRQYSKWRSYRSAGIFVAKEDGSDTIDYNCVFVKDRRKLAANTIFRGGEINCVFSDFELDLSECQIHEGKNVLEMNVVSATSVLYVPPDWDVKIVATKAFGMITDKRNTAKCPANSTSTLLITGTIAFGSSEIRTHTQTTE